MDLQALRILVVDDNRNAAEIVRSILGSVGAQNIQYESTAHGAYAMIQREAFDLLIVDQNLGKGDEGVQLVMRIRQDPTSPSPLVAILMLTGYTERRRVTAARDAGVTDFLSKPFTVTDLLKRIETLIFKPRSFARSEDYFGPDRRRRAQPDYAADRRKKT